MRTCENCSASMELYRSGARFCSTRCRVANHRRGNIPEAMRRRKRWVRWTKTKRPIMVNGWPASVTDPSTWSTYGEARQSSDGVGVGFVLGDGIGCYDLDDCFTGAGVLEPWAREVLDSVSDPLFVEVSQSGGGLHIFLRTDAPHGRVWRLGDHRVEFYPNKRYIAVTGRRFKG